MNGGELTYRSCPLCGGSQSIILSDRMQFKLDLTTVICRKCSFVFANPIPTKESIDLFYQTTYSTYYGCIAAGPEGENRKHIPVVTQRRIDQIEEIRPIAGRQLLEIGPGNGLFLWWAKKSGCQVVGIEPSKDFYFKLQQEGSTCINESIENIDTGTMTKSDFVVMLHVFEHFIDPNFVLQRCRELLTDEGLLVIEVPNILKPYKSLDRYFLRYVHLSYFSPQTLTSFLRKYGFNVLLLDEGDSGWIQPANLFVVAQRSDHSDHPLQQTIPDAEELLHYLRRYRNEWMVIRAPVWHSMAWYHRLRRFAYQNARRMKRKLVSTGERF
jgi:SAM-dependent methyltransferase